MLRGRACSLTSEFIGSAEATMADRETLANFAKRVEAVTGRTFKETPVLQEWPPIGGHIFCKRGHLVLVGVGYPDEDGDGVETWADFALVADEDLGAAIERYRGAMTAGREASGRMARQEDPSGSFLASRQFGLAEALDLGWFGLLSASQ